MGQEEKVPLEIKGTEGPSSRMNVLIDQLENKDLSTRESASSEIITNWEAWTDQDLSQLQAICDKGIMEVSVRARNALKQIKLRRTFTLCKSTTRARLKKINAAILKFKDDHNKYPEVLRNLIHRPDWVSQKLYRKRGYIQNEDEIRDGWGNEFFFQRPGEGDFPYVLLSYGADGRRGGTGIDRDINP